MSRSPRLDVERGAHNGIELRDYSLNEDYSEEPPSNRTSHSRGIRLYGEPKRRVMKPAPLAGW